MKKLVIVLLSILVAAPMSFAATPPKPMQVCMQPGGNWVAKAKCSKKETKANSFYFQPRLNGNCRTVTNSSTTYTSAARTDVTCNADEIMITHGYAITPISLTAPRQISLTFNDLGSPIGVSYLIQTEVSATDTPFTLIVSAACCYS